MIDAIGFKIRPDVIPRQTARAKMFLETSVKMHRKIGNYMVPDCDQIATRELAECCPIPAAALAPGERPNGALLGPCGPWRP